MAASPTSRGGLPLLWSTQETSSAGRGGSAAAMAILAGLIATRIPTASRRSSGLCARDAFKMSTASHAALPTLDSIGVRNRHMRVADGQKLDAGQEVLVGSVLDVRGAVVRAGGAIQPHRDPVAPRHPRAATPSRWRSATSTWCRASRRRRSSTASCASTSAPTARLRAPAAGGVHGRVPMCLLCQSLFVAREKGGGRSARKHEARAVVCLCVCVFVEFICWP